MPGNDNVPNSFVLNTYKFNVLLISLFVADNVNFVDS